MLCHNLHIWYCNVKGSSSIFIQFVLHWPRVRYYVITYISDNAMTRGQQPYLDLFNLHYTDPGPDIISKFTYITRQWLGEATINTFVQLRTTALCWSRVTYYVKIYISKKAMTGVNNNIYTCSTCTRVHQPYLHLFNLHYTDQGSDIMS